MLLNKGALCAVRLDDLIWNHCTGLHCARSALVGRPVVTLLLSESATSTTIHLAVQCKPLKHLPNTSQTPLKLEAFLQPHFFTLAFKTHPFVYGPVR